MSTESTLDLEKLLNPISEDKPGGDYLRRSDFERFQAAKDARAAAVSAERKIREFAMIDEDELAAMQAQGQGVDVPSPPDWRKVFDLCAEILSEHSKDLWVATWLIEANTRRNGFAGARDGFRMVTGLCERFWDNIYPPHDEDDGYMDTVSQLASLNGLDGPGTLIAPLDDLPLLPEKTDLTHGIYRQAVQGGGADYSEADFQNAARTIDLEALRRYDEDIAEAITAFDEMTSELAQKCDVDGEEDCTPPSSQISRALESIQQAFQSLTRNLLSTDEEATSDETGEQPSTALSGRPNPNANLAQTQVNNREDAFKMLMKASEFFRKTEPHSPVSYMLQQAVEFGRMDLPTLLEKLIRDEDVLKNFSERVGIPIKEDGYDDE